MTVRYEDGHLPRYATRLQLALVAGALVVAGVGVSCVPEDDAPPTTVILVRHAEKELEGDGSMGTVLPSEDPPLSEAGLRRALALAHVLGEAGVDAIYATQYLRTRSTARPLADLLGLDVIEATAGRDGYAEEMAELIRAEHAGEVVLVVGHSNTTPALIRALGAGPVPQIDEDEYDDLYVVTLYGDGSASLLALRYGVQTP